MARKTATRPENSSTSIAVIGEGLTEQYYLQSLKGIINAQIEPKPPNHSTGMNYLKDKIEDCIANGYAQIICLIDMDNKKEGKDKQQYDSLKKKYQGREFSRPKVGINSKVIFFENEPCLELWFLFHFKYTTAPYPLSDAIANELNDLCGYQKTERFFISTKGLHQYLINAGGDFKKARANAFLSIESQKEDERKHTYSEMNNFFALFLDK